MTSPSLRQAAIDAARLMADGRPVDAAAFEHLDDTPRTAPPTHHRRPVGRAFVPRDYAVPAAELDPAGHVDCATCLNWSAAYGTSNSPGANGQAPAGDVMPSRAHVYDGPGMEALDETTRGVVTREIGLRLTSQELEHAAREFLAVPQDALRYLQPQDYIGQDGQPDRAAVRAALQGLLTSHPHLGPYYRDARRAAEGSGQGAGQGVDHMRSRVDAVARQMNDWRY